jgi:FkbM family methyltransferase
MSIFYRVARSVSRAVGSDSAVARLARPVTERVLRAVAGRSGLAWQVNGIPCRIDPRFRAQLARTYDAHLAAWLQQGVKPGQTCLDVGANIGAWVIQFGRMVGPSGKVVAFEPNPGARAVLDDHIRMNDLGGVARVVPAAVGAAAGEVTFFAAGADGMSRIGQPNPGLDMPSEKITVPVVTLDAWCRENEIAPDWLLIDVEGFEGHVLAGATGLVTARGPALGVVVEMHPSLWPASGTTRDEVAARIAAVGRRAVPLSGQADPFAEYGHVRLDSVDEPPPAA